ncbi:MAG: sigma-70 family RNA polymerase sigma factor [Mycoplasmoidaceae bacterium]
MTLNTSVNLIIQYQDDPKKYQENINILWKNIGHIIIGSFYKKWKKWMSVSNLNWEDSVQDLFIGFINAANSFDPKGTYDVGKWLFLKSTSYAMNEIIKQLNKKNLLINNYISYDDNNNNFSFQKNLKTADLEKETIKNIDIERKFKLIKECLNDLEKSKKWSKKIKIFRCRIDGMSSKEISLLFNTSISDIKNAIFAVRKKIKNYIMINAPDLLK